MKVDMNIILIKICLIVASGELYEHEFQDKLERKRKSDDIITLHNDKKIMLECMHHVADLFECEICYNFYINNVIPTIENRFIAEYDAKLNETIDQEYFEIKDEIENLYLSLENKSRAIKILRKNSNIYFKYLSTILESSILVYSLNPLLNFPIFLDKKENQYANGVVKCDEESYEYVRFLFSYAEKIFQDFTKDFQFKNQIVFEIFDRNSITLEMMNNYVISMVDTFNDYLNIITLNINNTFNELNSVSEYFIYKYITQTNKNIISKKDTSETIIREILSWFKQSILYFYCKSEISYIQSKLGSHINSKDKFVTNLVYVYFFAERIIFKNNFLTSIMNISDNSYLKFMNSETFLNDLISFKCLLLEIIKNYIISETYFYKDYKLTIFFLFYRKYLKSTEIFPENLDFWIIKENITQEKMQFFEENVRSSLRYENFKEFTEYERNINIIIRLKQILSQNSEH